MRYARVNTLKISTKECIEKIKQLGFQYIEDERCREEGLCFTKDEHIEDLLVFPPRTDLTKTEIYRSGALVLQDKASCMPVAVLSPPPGSFVIDSCAAPGNKTTQLSAAVGRLGHVTAFERDPKRYDVLVATLEKHDCSHARAICIDFLKVNPLDYPRVEYCLVDPSCSGSGILEEFEISDGRDVADSEHEDRLKALSNFQCTILRHSMKCTV
jgi:putative methyltransferase